MEQDSERDANHFELKSGELDAVARFVRDLAETMKATNLSRLALRSAGLKITLESLVAAEPVSVVSVPRQSAADAPEVDSSETDDVDGHAITAPMIGTFYMAPAPNEPPFVEVGDRISEGQTIGIIEAMKIMNEIASDRSGEVVEIVAQDGETVEYGSPLVILSPSEN